MIKQVIDITDDWTSGLGGLRVGQYIDQTFRKNYQTPIELSFYGIEMITPSFVNGAFIYPIDLYGDDFFTKFVKIKQIKPKVANVIRSSIQGYNEHRNSFLQQLKTNNIYCAIDGSDESINFRYKLYESTVNKDHNFYFNPDDSVFSEVTWQKIRLGDVCIGIITQQFLIENILKQINYALSQNKPCILLCMQGIPIHIPTETRNKIQIIYYNQNNYYEAIRGLNELILNGKQGKNLLAQKAKDADNAAILALGGAAFLVLLLGILNKK